MKCSETFEICGTQVRFSIWWLLNEQITMYVPDGFSGVDRLNIKKTYTNQMEPHSIIYDYSTNTQTAIFYGMNNLTVSDPTKLIGEYIRQEKTSGRDILETGSFFSELGEIQFLSSHSHNITQRVWILTFESQPLLFIANANCAQDRQQYWETVFYYMQCSMRPAKFG